MTEREDDAFAASGAPRHIGVGVPVDGRVGDWMATFSGGRFWPMDPRVEEVNIVDIAHHLSLQCRYAGAVRRFYSVAEHCVLMTRRLKYIGAGENVQRWALLHDASEAYMQDLIRPVKENVTGYREIEAKIMAVIAEAFELIGPEPEGVRQADHRMLNDEREQNTHPSPWLWAGPQEPFGVRLEYWPPAAAELEFLREHSRLWGV